MNTNVEELFCSLSLRCWLFETEKHGSIQLCRFQVRQLYTVDNKSYISIHNSHNHHNCMSGCGYKEVFLVKNIQHNFLHSRKLVWSVSMTQGACVC